jgi:hypothetical protein
MTQEPNHWNRYTIGPATATSARFTLNNVEGAEHEFTTGEWWLKDNVLTSFSRMRMPLAEPIFREETIYFFDDSPFL